MGTTIPATIANKAAARMTVVLPEGMQNKAPDQFVELIRLYSKHLSVLYQTVHEDFASDKQIGSIVSETADDVYLEFARQVTVEFIL